MSGLVSVEEDEDFLKRQIITYLGNKRSLLPLIERGILSVLDRLGKGRVSFLDLFSGTGVVSRFARKYATVIHCNDLERYSEITNRCYQSNISDIDMSGLRHEMSRVGLRVREDCTPGVIAELYAPQDDANIQPGERVFYTRRNAIFLDAFCRAIADCPEHFRPYILAPVLSQASMYANTSGVFKGFYKNDRGIGQFGGNARSALKRICSDINLEMPVLSRFRCDAFVHRQDANDLVRNLDHVDIAYLDPPYNQHPYGSNYFMLNLLCDYGYPAGISRVSGIPVDWNRSRYNKARHAEDCLFDAVSYVKARFVLISYNSEGFIKRESFLSRLSEMGRVDVVDAQYNAFRGSRNLSGRDMYVTESLYLLEKQ